MLVIGDVMIDKWTHHETLRMSPEAPVPIIKIQGFHTELGGAGNALRHLNNLSNSDHELITVIGADGAGFDLTTLGERNKNEIHLVTDNSRHTTVKDRFFVDGELQFRLDSEDLFEISADVESRLISKVDKVIEEFDVILLSDYAKGVLTASFVKKILDRAHDHNLPIVTDPGLGRVEIYAGCDVIKPNQKEWEEFIGGKKSEKEAIASLFNAGTSNILITLGALGLRLITPSLDVRVRPENSVQVVDVTGAGDSLAAGVALVRGGGYDIFDYLDRLNLIGGKTVSISQTNLPKIELI